MLHYFRPRCDSTSAEASAAVSTTSDAIDDDSGVTINQNQSNEGVNFDMNNKAGNAVKYGEESDNECSHAPKTMSARVLM